MVERILFMGTPLFALPSLEGLVADYQVVGVVTQPDRPAGRGRLLTPSAVKELALALGLPVLQPASLREKEIIDQIKSLEPKAIVVVAYGEIIPPAILQAAPCLNLHPSLLPKYRGASPVAAAILAGEEKTGVTIIQMDEGMDTGPILAQAEEEILPQDTTASLSERLSKRGAELLLETLPRWLAKEVQPQPQDKGQASYTRSLKKEDGFIAWQKPAAEIARQVRAYFPWPGSYTTWEGKTFKILSAHLQSGDMVGKLGEVIAWGQGAGVVTGDGLLVLDKLQLAGKREMDIAEFLRGYPSFLGSRLGSV